VEAKKRIVQHYLASDLSDPFAEWMATLRDQKAYGIILVRIERVRSGNFGDHRPVGSGVSELRVSLGPGYRIYYGQDGEKVILLTGGEKRTQRKDIARAQRYWTDYNA
jgi:putative addiction module killer protein